MKMDTWSVFTGTVYYKRSKPKYILQVRRWVTNKTEIGGMSQIKKRWVDWFQDLTKEEVSDVQINLAMKHHTTHSFMHWRILAWVVPTIVLKTSLLQSTSLISKAKVHPLQFLVSLISLLLGPLPQNIWKVKETYISVFDHVQKRKKTTGCFSCPQCCCHISAVNKFALKYSFEVWIKPLLLIFPHYLTNLEWHKINSFPLIVNIAYYHRTISLFTQLYESHIFRNRDYCMLHFKNWCGWAPALTSKTWEGTGMLTKNEIN